MGYGTQRKWREIRGRGIPTDIQRDGERGSVSRGHGRRRREKYIYGLVLCGNVLEEM